MPFPEDDAVVAIIGMGSGISERRIGVLAMRAGMSKEGKLVLQFMEQGFSAGQAKAPAALGCFVQQSEMNFSRITAASAVSV